MIHAFLKKYIGYATLVLVIFAIAAPLTYASGRLLMGASPRTPFPGQKFTVTATSLEFDTLRGNFRWFLNDKMISSGVGRTEETFQAGTIGSTMVIRVVATSFKNELFEGTITIRVNDIDFIVHPLTSVPPLYRGAPLAVSGSDVEIFAVPHVYIDGKKVDPKDLVYEWTVDDRKNLEQSGGGHNRLALTLNSLRDQEISISLTASTLNDSTIAVKQFVLKTYDPEVLFYSWSPLTGIGHLAHIFFDMNGGDTKSVLAVPYFLSNQSLAHASYEWKANNNPIKQNPSNPRLLELSAPPDTKSISTFSLKIQDPSVIYQRAEGSFSVNVGQQQ